MLAAVSKVARAALDSLTSRPRTLWGRSLARSSLLREYLWKYRRLVGVGLLSLVVVDALDVVPPLLLKEAVDAVVSGDPAERQRTLLKLALLYFGVALAQSAGRYGWRMYLIRSSMLSGRDLRNRFAGHLFGLSASFFDKRRIGELMSLGTTDVEAVRMAIGAGLLTLADALFYFLTVPIAMYWLSPELTLLAFLPLPLIPWFVARNQRLIHERFEKVQESFSRLSALAQENLNGIRVIKAFAREDSQISRFAAVGAEHIRLSLHLARVQTAFGPTLDFVMSLGMVALLFVGGGYAIDGAVSLGTFVAFQRYVQKMIWPMTAVGMAFTFYQRAIASSGRIKEVLSVSSDTPEPAVPKLPHGYDGRTAGRIEFRNLTFAFPGAQSAVLSAVSLTIEPGERVAFIGGIGSGKSALLALLPRLYPVAPGMLFIDGVDVNDWPLSELRRQVGYVSQDVFLFNESVAENVAFGARRELPPLELQEAVRLAAINEEILGHDPEGYATRLGERGVSLSGGQKQRLTIARALAMKPSILVLDDALSSVDVQTEERILKGLRERPERNTELIAAHRISTVRDADRIVVLEAGRVQQLGTHRELSRRDGTYRLFLEQQKLKRELESYLERREKREVAE